MMNAHKYRLLIVVLFPSIPIFLLAADQQKKISREEFFATTEKDSAYAVLHRQVPNLLGKKDDSMVVKSLIEPGCFVITMSPLLGIYKKEHCCPPYDDAQHTQQLVNYYNAQHRCIARYKADVRIITQPGKTICRWGDFFDHTTIRSRLSAVRGYSNPQHIPGFPRDIPGCELCADCVPKNRKDLSEYTEIELEPDDFPSKHTAHLANSSVKNNQTMNASDTQLMQERGVDNARDIKREPKQLSITEPVSLRTGKPTYTIGSAFAFLGIGFLLTKQHQKIKAAESIFKTLRYVHEQVPSSHT